LIDLTSSLFTGLCRFISEASARGACRAAERGSINVDGRFPEIFELQSYSAPEPTGDPSVRQTSDTYDEDEYYAYNSSVVDIAGADGIETALSPYASSPITHRMSLPSPISNMRGSFGSSVSSTLAPAGQLQSPPCYPRTFKSSTSSSTLSTAPCFLDDSEASAGSAYMLPRNVHEQFCT